MAQKRHKEHIKVAALNFVVRELKVSGNCSFIRRQNRNLTERNKNCKLVAKVLRIIN